MSVLAIIPARSGSKGLKDKNILKLAGHPLLAYSIVAAKSSKLIDHVICSTDSEKIAKIAESYGAHVPGLRPANLAGDFSLDIDVFRYTLEQFMSIYGYLPELVINLRPTSPIRSLELIDTAISLLKDNKKYSSLRSICKSEKSAFKMWFLKEDKILEPVVSNISDKLIEPYNAPRQLLRTSYHQTATIDIVRAKVIMENNSMSGEKIYGYEIDPFFAIDIDFKLDFEKAEVALKSKKCISIN